MLALSRLPKGPIRHAVVPGFSKPGPHGSIALIASSVGLCHLRLTARNIKETRNWLAHECPTAQHDPELYPDFQQQLRDYVAGVKIRFDVPVDLSPLTAFQRSVLAACATIDYGQVVRYGDLARQIGNPLASRAVGAALGKNPVPLVIPCHRVIGGQGQLVGFSAEQGIALKRWLLDLEATPQKLDMKTTHQKSARRRKILIQSQ